jgi:sulfur-oxidizing protein SoxY
MPAPRPGRRQCLIGLAGSLILFHLRPAVADTEAQAVLARVLGVHDALWGGVELTLPRLAETGYVVPLTVAVDSPMTPLDHVQELVVLAPSNPQPEVFRAFLGPHNGVARVHTRIRLAVSQPVLAAARLSDGRWQAAAAEVEVTVGGCNP